MKNTKFLSILSVLLLSAFTTYAQVTGFTLSPSGPNFYKTNGIGAISNITVAVTVGSTPLTTGNKFRVEISDASGTFPGVPTYVEVAPVAGGTVASSVTNVLVNIPNATPATTGADNGYRFRIRWDNGDGIYNDFSTQILPTGPSPWFQLQDLPIINITAAGLLPGGVAGTKFCSGGLITFGIAPGSFTKVGSFGGSNTFFLDVSDASGNFSTDWYQGSQVGIGSIVSSNPNIIYGTIPVPDVAPIGSYNNGEVKSPFVFGTGHKFRIRSSNPVAYSNELSFYTIINTPGLATPVAGQWTAYVYSDRVTPYIQFDKYSGAFNAGTANSFASNTFYSINGAPSEAGGYVGCAVGTDYHSVSYQRTGFACGFYQFDVNIDDDCRLFVDGVQVYTKTGAVAVANVWRCFLGASSTVEFRVSDKTSSSTANLTLTLLSSNAALQSIANPTICTGNSTTLTAVPVTGANINTGTLTYVWSPATGLNTTTGATVIANPVSNTTYTVVATNSATGCTNSRSVAVGVVSSLTVSVNPASASICPGAGVTLVASGAATYTWSPATGLNTTTGATVIATPSITTTYTVTGTSGACTNSKTVVVTVGPVLGATTFGNGVWNVYAYSNSGSTPSDGFAVLLGSYTETNLNYDTRTRWDQYTSPSSAGVQGGTLGTGLGYTGCKVNNDYHSYKYLRTNFTCGIYQIVVNGNDDNITLFVDGVQKFTRGYNTTAANIWRGFLGPTSTLEVRTVDISGGSFTQLSILPVDAITMSNPTICTNVATTLTATTTPDGPDAQVNTSYTWVQTGGTAIAFTGSGSSVTFPGSATPGTFTYQCTITNNLVGTTNTTCSVVDAVTVTVTNVAPIGAINPNPATICGGSSVTLTATGGNLYQWYYMDSTTIKDATNTLVGNPGSDPVHWRLAGVAASYLTPVTGVLTSLSLLTSTNGSVIAAPLVSTRYAVIISIGGSCPTGIAYTNVIVGAASNPANFIPNLWYAYCYNSNNFTNYYGYYTVTSQSFNTNTRWAASASPSSATGNNLGTSGAPGLRYYGCAIPSDNFSINFKRQGFTCGFYQISFPSFDDDINLRIGAGDATGTTTTALATVPTFPRTGATSANNVWRGFLGTPSQIEITLKEYSGNAGVDIQLSNITAAVQSTLITSAPVVACQGSTVILAADLPSTNAPASTYTYTWTSSSPDITFSPFSGTSATGLGANVNAIVAAAATNQFITITCTVTDNITGCTIVQTKPSQIEINTTFTTTLVSDKSSVCSGELVTLTASGASVYNWSLTTGTGGTFRFPNATGSISKVTNFPAGTYSSTLAGAGNSYGDVVLFSPGGSTNYTIMVTGSTGGTCTSGSATLDISIVNILVFDPGYGVGKWNVVCYNGTSPTISAYVANGSGSIGTNVRGYYDENELSFNTEARWDKTLAPSIPTVNTTSGSAYVGCPLDNDFHTVVYKRTGIPCNIYRIDIGDFTNALDLIVNGVVVFTSPVGLSHKFNAWNGSLSPTDEVEVRMYHTTADSYYSVNFAVIPPPASSVIWTGGGGNSDWQNVNNWCAGLPERVTDIYIPAGNPFSPVVNSLLAATIPIECRNVYIAPGATLTVNAGFNLNVYGNWENKGTFTQDPTSFVRFKGLDSVNIGGTSPTTFTNVEFQKGGAIVSLGINTTISHTMNLQDVQLQLNNQTLTINNSSPSAISRSNDSYILSETNAAYNPSILCWNMTGQPAGTVYELPFGTSKSYYIPVMFTKNTGDAYTICASTRSTTDDNKPYAQNQASTWTASIVDASLVIDRWWDITSTLNPLPGAGAQISFYYGWDSNTLPGTTTSLEVFHYDPSNLTWDAPYVPAVVNVPVSSGIGFAKSSTSINKFSPHVIGDHNAALPVSLVDFSAKTNGKDVLLEWQTATELDNDYFTVERSTDAKTFEAIGKVKSKASNSNALTYYSLTDDKPIYGISYYRLKQTDINGAKSYSKILSVELGTNLELILMPNPTTRDNIRILVMGESDSQVGFSMKDLEGRPVYSEVIEIGETGKTEVKISESKSLAAGVYICTIQVGTKTITKKLVVQ